MTTLKSWLKTLQRLKMSLWHYITQGKRGTLLPLIHPNTQKLLPSNIYHHCNELPLYIFINCTCDKDYRGLVKYGKATEADINRAWELIYSEYSDTSGNPTTKLLIQLSKDISWHEAKLRACALALKVLQHVPDQRCINVLKGYGYNYPFDITNPEQYAQSLDIIATRLQSVSFLIQQKTAEYQRESKGVSGKPMTREGFDVILATISKHSGIKISDLKKETVSEFIAYRKNYEREMEAIARYGKPEHAAMSGSLNMRNV